MKCPECQVEDSGESKFCRECGAQLLMLCPKCGRENRSEDRFCGECGKALEEEITESKTGGERKHITVLFSDLSGYTELAEKLDPEEVKDIISQLFDGASEIIVKYGGFVEKFVGDAIMAIFGVPDVHEDDPLRAIKTAREIHDLVGVKSNEYEDKIGRPLSMHSGINTGLVVTGDVDAANGTHGVAGDTINLAARLSSLSKDGEILVGPDTYQQAGGYFTFENLGPTRIKGRSQPVEVYKVLVPRKIPRKIHRPLGRRAELIGRSTEMVLLDEAAQRLKKGESSIISIIGDAGTGKSRLIEEFQARLDHKAIQWQQGHAYAYAQRIPYFPITDLLNHTFQINEQDSPEKIKAKIESNIANLVEDKADIIPYIGGLFALNYPEFEEVSPEFWKSKLYGSVLEVLASLCQRAPTIICLEDLHWADPSTLELIQYTFSKLIHPVLFLSVYRPTFHLFKDHPPDNLEKTYHEIQLQELSSAQAREMIRSLLETETFPSKLKDFLQKKAEGNPFYLEEVINALIESQMLIQDNGSWKITPAFSEFDIPATIQGVIESRIDRLGNESKQVLQEASVIGRIFLYEILKRISDPVFHIDQFLSDLENLDLIRTKSIQPELEYIFKHALIQETAYNSLLIKDRGKIHERIGRVIEQFFSDRLPEFYETLAYHFSKGESELKAIDYLILSGDKSLKHYALEEAHLYFKQAYDLIIARPEKNQQELGMIIDIVNKWASVFYFIGDVSGFMRLLKAHEEDAEKLNDLGRQGMYYAWFGWAKGMQEQVNESFYYLEKALEIGEKIDDPLVVGYACTWLIFSCMEELLEKGVVYGKKAFEIAKDIESDQYMYFKSLGGIGHIYYLQGKRRRISEIAKRLLDYGTRHSHVRCLTLGHICSGYDHEIAGDFPAAIKCYQEAMAVSKDPIYTHWAGLFLATAYLANGQIKEAEAPLQEIVSYSQKYGYGILGTVADAAYGVVLIDKGYMSQGLKTLEEARQSSLKNQRTWVYAFVEYLLGSAYAEMAKGGKSIKFLTMAKNIGFLIKNVPRASKKAEDHFSQTIKVAKEIGANGLLGPAYLDLSLLFIAKKKNELAKTYINEAIDIFEQSGAEVYLKQAREALASLK
ncbi:MAG: AAA family ATPase [Desulfobacterales bacterium]|jgi:class 3 adenylate cyclase/tetratricopeptide (TPR) repeat protein|nr:AAA family ATPase [Desulfobacterales bacterium]